jgi:hypothetical protein
VCTFVHIRNEYTPILDHYNISYRRRDSSSYEGGSGYGGGRRGGRYNNSFGPKPVEVGKEYSTDHRKKL